MANKKEGLWLAREQQMLEQLNRRVKFYIGWAAFNQLSQRTLSIVVLICAVLAPVTVSASPDVNLGVFGISDPGLRKLSLLLTLTLAFAEGLRRTFYFDHRWAVCANCREKLQSLRNTYLDQQIELVAGSEKWVTNLSSTRKRFEEVVMDHVNDFAQMLMSRREGDGARFEKPI